ncbi:alpha/beta fold hydrolase [Novosphingobium sp.]|uniref:alpha/beta fold hydrolase n=1 Tax=Novosphingobium sp. TaxID=1874826 RepID=UPI001EBA53A9|nr:alpha/beta fold hydrolase [Novosphingobium sp.]MBK6800620.1 alpha/beta fold hydrolase [Novosphingobium sp.]MBK9011176.1 alpha/beta fold hydrolase [Novosphingobium sp.]
MGLPIVLITGQLLTDAVWQPLLDAWGDREVIVADNRSDDTIAGFATRLLDSAPPRFVLIGHAMGGFVAFEVMRRAPQRVAKLVLISTLASADGPAQTARRQGYIDLVQAGKFETVVEERIPILFPEARRGDERLLGIARQMAAETGAETFLAQQRAIMARENSRPRLGEIAVPTLVIWGEEDGITSRAHQEELVSLIDGSRLAVVPGAGHLVTLEAPEVVVPLVDAFLDA